MCHVSLSVKGKIPAYSRLILTLPQTDTAIAVNMSLTVVSRNPNTYRSDDENILCINIRLRNAI